MKRKWVLLLLAIVLGSAIFMHGCGKDDPDQGEIVGATS